MYFICCCAWKGRDFVGGVYSCPVGLQPVQIMQAVKNNDKEALEKKLNIKACILCGMCTYTCTSKIHLTEYCRKAKKMIGGVKK